MEHFGLWVAVVALAALNTIATQFIDRKELSPRAKWLWSGFVVVLVSAGGILTVTRAMASKSCD